MSKTIHLTHEINSQTFAVVRIAKTGITLFPVENLASIQSEWRPVTLDEIMTEHDALLVVAKTAKALLDLCKCNQTFAQRGACKQTDSALATIANVQGGGK